MGTRRRSQRSYPPLRVQLIWTQSQQPSCCSVCKATFDLPTLSVRRGQKQAHVFCAILDQVGLSTWTQRSKR